MIGLLSRISHQFATVYSDQNKVCIKHHSHDYIMFIMQRYGGMPLEYRFVWLSPWLSWFFYIQFVPLSNWLKHDPHKAQINNHSTLHFFSFYPTYIYLSWDQLSKRATDTNLSLAPISLPATQWKFVGNLRGKSNFYTFIVSQLSMSQLWRDWMIICEKMDRGYILTAISYALIHVMSKKPASASEMTS
jgi:hypothetical protein